MTEEIRCLAISDQDMDAGNAATVTELVDKVVVVFKDAKKLRGSIIFEFGRFDKDPRPNFMIPEVRRYIQLIDQAHPYFCYFLPESPEVGQVRSWLMCLAAPAKPDGVSVSGIYIDPREFATMVKKRIEAIRDLCGRILDDPSSTENAILHALPTSIASVVAATTERLS